jgi:hypothetical protein
MTAIVATNTVSAPVSSFTWDNEENAKNEFFAMMETKRKEMEMEEENRMEAEGFMLPVSPAPKLSPVEHDMDETGEETEEDYSPDEDQEDTGFVPEGEDNFEEKDWLGFDQGTPDLFLEKLSPEDDVVLCFRASESVVIDFTTRKAKEAWKAAQVLSAQQKGKFPITIEHRDSEEGEVLFKYTYCAPKGTSAYKGVSTKGTGAKSSDPDALAEKQRKAEEAARLKAEKQAKREAEKALRESLKQAELIAKAQKAARNAPDENTVAFKQFEAMCSEHGATYSELDAMSGVTGGGWNSTAKAFCNRFSKDLWKGYRRCATLVGTPNAKKPKAAIKLVPHGTPLDEDASEGWELEYVGS